jgi:2-phosphosulfolactate phosphatase
VAVIGTSLVRVRVHVAFTPDERTPARVGVVVDVLRATSTICQALASGYGRVLCCAEVDQARALAESEGPAKLAGERRLEPIEGFDFGNSPSELEGEPAAETLVLTTTNGTGLLVAAAERFERVFVGSLLNLDAVAAAARESGEDVAVLCAGVLGELALDDAYCAGRIAEALGGEPQDSARAAILLAQSFPDALEGLGASRSAANLRRHGLEADVERCARENVLDVVPRYLRRVGPAAEVTL